MMRKTEVDIKRERIAGELNERLLRSGIRVVGGVRSGPYAVTITYLNRRELDKLIPAILAATGRELREGEPGR